jgi:hypothetical protein
MCDVVTHYNLRNLRVPKDNYVFDSTSPQNIIA